MIKILLTQIKLRNSIAVGLLDWKENKTKEIEKEIE